MKKTNTYLMILGLVAILSSCQGRNASIYDPSGGANARSAAQIMANTGSLGTTTQTNRTQDVSYVFNQQQVQQCNQELIAANDDLGAVSAFCQQVLLSFLYQMGYLTYGQDEIVVNLAQPGMAAGAHPASFTFNRGQLLNNNAGWFSGYQNQMAGQPYTAGGQIAYPRNFQFPVGSANNMSQFCGGNTGVITNMTYANPCGSLNYNWVSIYSQANNGRMMFMDGNYQGAGNVFGATGPIQTQCPHVFRGAVAFRTQSRLSSQDVNAQNRNLEKIFQQDWKNLKAKPKNLALRGGDAAMNLLDSYVERVFSGFEANLNQQSTNNYLIADYNQASIDHNNRLLAQNQQLLGYYSDIALTTTTVGVHAMDPENGGCPPKRQLEYIVAEGEQANNGFIIQCPNSN